MPNRTVVQSTLYLLISIEDLMTGRNDPTGRNGKETTASIRARPTAGCQSSVLASFVRRPSFDCCTLYSPRQNDTPTTTMTTSDFRFSCCWLVFVAAGWGTPDLSSSCLRAAGKGRARRIPSCLAASGEEALYEAATVRFQLSLQGDQHFKKNSLRSNFLH